MLRRRPVWPNQTVAPPRRCPIISAECFLRFSGRKWPQAACPTHQHSLAQPANGNLQCMGPEMRSLCVNVVQRPQRMTSKPYESSIASVNDAVSHAFWHRRCLRATVTLIPAWPNGNLYAHANKGVDYIHVHVSLPLGDSVDSLSNARAQLRL